MYLGFGLVLIGILLLLNNLGIIKGDAWDYIWPMVIILLGLSMFGRNKDCCTPKIKIIKDKDEKK